MSEAGVYQIRNIINDKRYIGSSINLKKRQAEHRRRLRDDCHRNQHLQNAWDKHGEDAFIFETIAYTHPALCLRLEQAALDMYNPEYNIASDTSAPMLGRTHANETRMKMSEAHKGNKYCLGYKHSQETIDKHRKSMMGNAYCLGRKLTEEHKAKVSWLGRKHTEETKAKMSAAAMGNTNGLGNTNGAKLTELDVYEIRRLYATGEVMQKTLAKMFRIGKENISAIVLRTSWRHLQ